MRSFINGLAFGTFWGDALSLTSAALAAILSIAHRRMTLATFVYAYLGGRAPQYIDLLLVAFGLFVADTDVAAVTCDGVGEESRCHSYQRSSISSRSTAAKSSLRFRLFRPRSHIPMRETLSNSARVFACTPLELGMRRTFTSSSKRKSRV
jgi:hypothetical protein